MKVEIDPDDVQKVKADGRGRVYLGTEYADMEGIEVAILNDPTPDKGDPRSEEMKREMAEHFAKMEEDYRSADWCNIVYEDDEVVLVEDTKGYEWSEWQDEFGDGFSEAMHELAGQLTDRRWPATYPLVFDKLEGHNYTDN